MTVKSLLKQANKMDIDERTALAHLIWQSVEDECDDGPVSDEIKAELDRRWADHEKNPDAGFTWDELKRKLAKIRKRKKRA